MLNVGFFPAKYPGVTCADAYYDQTKWNAAVRKTVIEMAPDLYMMSPQTPGTSLEALDYKQMVWPGRGISSDHTFQFVEGEYMRADEYDIFLENPSDFLIRYFLPRVSSVFEPLRRLPNLAIWLLGIPASLGTPGLDEVAAALNNARRDIVKSDAETAALENDLAGEGFPLYAKAVCITPFDVISDRLRGMRGSMLDMYRQPDKLIRACQKLLPMILRNVIARAKATANPRVFIPLHRGSEGFMSLKQFETFYWPALKGLLLGLIESGLTPCPFFEGNYDSRLEYLLELPKGKVLGHFDDSDIHRVKEVVGKNICIMGNVPASLLQIGGPQEVKDYCKKLIDIASPGGGFVLAPRSCIDEAKPENIKAMLDFTREYGVYK